MESLGIRQKSCRDCQHGHQARFYQEHKEEEKERTRRRRVNAREEAREFIFQYKLTHPCERRGVSDPRVLDFHHVRGKGATINQLLRVGWIFQVAPETVANWIHAHTKKLALTQITEKPLTTALDNIYTFV